MFKTSAIALVLAGSAVSTTCTADSSAAVDFLRNQRRTYDLQIILCGEQSDIYHKLTILAPNGSMTQEMLLKIVDEKNTVNLFVKQTTLILKTDLTGQANKIDIVRRWYVNQSRLMGDLGDGSDGGPKAAVELIKTYDDLIASLEF